MREIRRNIHPKYLLGGFAAAVLLASSGDQKAVPTEANLVPDKISPAITLIKEKEAVQQQALKFYIESTPVPTRTPPQIIEENPKQVALAFDLKEIMGEFYKGCRVVAHTIGVGSTYSIGGCLGCNPDLRTASGDKLDDNKLALATWVYPLRSKVKVTNLDTGNSALAEINDLGGFDAERNPNPSMIKIPTLRKRIFDATLKLAEVLGGIYSDRTRLDLALLDCA